MAGTTSSNEHSTDDNHSQNATSRDPVTIRKQLHHFFGNFSLPVDNHMMPLVKGYKNHAVSLKDIHEKFNSMKRFQPYEAVRDAVKGSDFLEIDENDMIKRREPLGRQFTKDIGYNRLLLDRAYQSTSLLARGFPPSFGSKAVVHVQAFLEELKPICVRCDIRGRHYNGEATVIFGDPLARINALEAGEKGLVCEWKGEEYNITFEDMPEPDEEDKKYYSVEQQRDGYRHPKPDLHAYRKDRSLGPRPKRRQSDADDHKVADFVPRVAGYNSRSRPVGYDSQEQGRQSKKIKVDGGSANSTSSTVESETLD